MNKAELVAAMSKDNGLGLKTNAAVMDSFMKVTEKTVAKGGSVTLVNFMNIFAVKRAARKGRNPMTKAEIAIPATYSPKVTFGKSFKEKVVKSYTAKAEKRAANKAAAAAATVTPAPAAAIKPAAVGKGAKK